MSAPKDPRQARLRTEQERLEELHRESDFVRVHSVDVLSGSAPERYRVTLLCRGIVGIDSSRAPVYGTEHVVEIYCDESFPADVPQLHWVTPIWHPNIHHVTKGVCVNKSEWLGGQGLDDLCRQMFEMVQYKNYHAESTKPYPLDTEVAKWVLEYAQPKGIVDKRRNLFVDDKPFVRPAPRLSPAPPSQPQPPRPRRVKLLSVPPSSPPQQTPQPPQQPAQTRLGVRILPSVSAQGSARRVTILNKG